MNTHYLMEHVSRHLHTLIRRYSASWDLLDAFCARADLQDDHMGHVLTDYFSLPDNSRSIPVFVSLDQQAVYASIPAGKEIFLLGPVTFSVPVNIRRQHSAHQIDSGLIPLIPVCDFQEFISDVLLISNLLCTRTISEEDLLRENCIQPLVKYYLEKDHTAYIFENREICKLHNPYDQEFREFTSIENGNIEELQNSLSEDYPGEIGLLAKTPLRHMKNRGIVVIALASRAAIRGGILPETAYSLSDSYIQKIEECCDIPTVLHLFHSAEYHYARMVRDHKKEISDLQVLRPNKYTEECKTYIFSHLHEKICVKDIAGKLNIHANYLSELFHEHEGITITAYIQREKIRLAKNLLTYSKYTYSEIAAYLGYSSQSHLGKQFKQLAGMTMYQYRNKYGAKYF
ncbi:helix-turn-helix domain-containing protein [Murimonas intestini]|uniref:AraC-like DNA-binding protein n=1 Tax=Murimonas intestini TaxID=1337051 RepID=A0AB73TAA3_9FIRM|nr:AraC family transcriptional regulator [Murimonas intestini]MCR1838965.1 AraC family transcriptional regulator [Murimonas intestini]MCR1864261.1 AraC family transcriptional regulator [Murimonas intestini]MCR1881871.1 AraC family transcriptional regulator [Murimonas intestini]